MCRVFFCGCSCASGCVWDFRYVARLCHNKWPRQKTQTTTTPTPPQRRDGWDEEAAAGQRWQHARSGRVGTGSHASYFRTVSFTVGVSFSLSRARALTFSLSAGGLSTLGVFLSGFFSAQHTDCEDHPKIIRSCERVHRPTVTATSAADTPTMPTTPTTTPPTTTSPLVRIIYARMRPL